MFWVNPFPFSSLLRWTHNTTPTQESVALQFDMPISPLVPERHGHVPDPHSSFFPTGFDQDEQGERDAQEEEHREEKSADALLLLPTVVGVKALDQAVVRQTLQNHQPRTRQALHEDPLASE